MTVLLPAAAGALVVAGVIGLVAGARRTPVAAPGPPRSTGRVVARLRRTSRRTLVLAGIGLAAGAVVAVATGWFLAVLLVPAVLAGVPVLLGPHPAAVQIDRLEAMEEWTRSLSGVLTAGVGLEQALTATLRSTPAPIVGEVSVLVARLRARWTTEAALRAFAEDLDDPTGDLIAANLILGARRRAAGLATVLDALAASVAADVRARRTVEADRAKPRATARWVTVITVGVLAVLALTGSYVAPYGSGIGQVILAVLLAVYAALLVWMRVMAIGQPPPRFLGQERRHDRGGGWVAVSTGLQLALAGGALLGLGVALVVWRLVPADPDLADALRHLSPTAPRSAGRGTPAAVSDRRDRVGLWVMRTLPVTGWGRAPVQELALLRVPLNRYYGEKVGYTVIGLVAGPLFTALVTLAGVDLPVLVPVAGTVAFAAGLSFLPDYNARDDAKRARVEFARAMSAYIDLVALERNSGAGSRQAMETAALVGDSWVFRRLSEELARSRWSGQAPWNALRALADELALPELSDLADIVRLSGEEGAQIYAQLRARSAALRSAMLADELTAANETNERMTIPMAALGGVFMAILIAPALLRLLGGEA